MNPSESHRELARFWGKGRAHNHPHPHHTELGGYPWSNRGRCRPHRDPEPRHDFDHQSCHVRLGFGFPNRHSVSTT
ncbi:hypothetical protein CH63R_10069 [Colletotrichum higginsianum IMI 349063]|uniref:Uncharacterized protein n=1 Tax=Colletotrichum higginsianum (strain IMI 349063) TaxID=759273 RepID=A0A1B7Y1S2_COLHI|nr:uncharacterized protein CH63R_10069 [Colletotrichum higginsianum IMI 349063]OBR05949.1 hypothetical protein CH63R_10069 [Colletotrichum higginsianum IMI 349063]